MVMGEDSEVLKFPMDKAEFLRALSRALSLWSLEQRDLYSQPTLIIKALETGELNEHRIAIYPNSQVRILPPPPETSA